VEELTDRHGRHAADEALCAVAHILQGVRESDHAFRTGAHEFAVVLPGTSALGARIVGERLVDRIASAGVGCGLLRAGYRVVEREPASSNQTCVPPLRSSSTPQRLLI
jgi:PleD family two-component response regulator